MRAIHRRTAVAASLGILGALGALGGLGGCLFLGPDEESGPITLQIAAAFEPDEPDEADLRAAAAIDCPAPTDYGPDADLSARVEIRRDRAGDAKDVLVLKAPLDAVFEDGAWFVVGDVTFPRGAASDEYTVTLELLLQAAELAEPAEFRGTVTSHDIPELDACIRRFRIGAGPDSVDLCASGDAGEYVLALSSQLSGTFATTVDWPPGGAIQHEEDVTVEVSLHLLPVRVAFGAFPIGRLGPDPEPIIVPLRAPAGPPRCPGDSLEELAGTIVWDMADETLPDAVGDVLLVRDGQFPCLECPE